MRSLITVSFAVTVIIISITGCLKLSDEQLMNRAEKLESEEKFSKAAEIYEKVASLHPESPLADSALYRAAIVYTGGLKKFSKAISLFKRIVDEYPESRSAPQSQFMIGYIYANTIGDTTMARSAYKRFLEKYPDHELVPSVRWELKYLGRDINDIPELKNLEGKN